jgi:predicted secreted protein
MFFFVMEMITKFKTVLLCFFIVLFQFTLCDTMWAFDKFAGEETIIVPKEQNGQEITVKTGNLIQIELAEIGSAGYSWYIDNLNSQYLELVSEETRGISEEGKIGAPVMHVWRFKAKKVGQTEIKMDYYRKWEGVKKSTDHFFIKINVVNNKRRVWQWKRLS